MKKIKGFTLIELLIVIAIIGILATLVTTTFMGIQTRARDGERKSDLKQIQSALELYRSDNGVYPTPNLILVGYHLCGPQGHQIQCPTYYSTLVNPCKGSFPLTPTPPVYMQSVPCDPQSSGPAPTPYSYVTNLNANQYCLRACLENTNDSESDINLHVTPSVGCNSCANTSNNYTVQNP